MFTDKVVVVTGAASGIGLATAVLFAERGATVVPVGLIPAGSHPADLPDGFVAGDVTSAAFVADLADRVRKDHGTVDVVVNNAGILRHGTVEETTPDEWDLVLRTNLTSAYLVSRTLIPLMRPRGGSIVNIASVHAQGTVERYAAYAASKGGVLALTRQMAIDYVADRIRVNAVLPGSVDTAMSSSVGLSEQEIAVRRDPTRLARVADPSEIATAICFLASSDASFVTGAGFAVDGGMLARLFL